MLAAPSTAETRHAISRAALAHAKPGLHLINIARGNLVQARVRDAGPWLLLARDGKLSLDDPAEKHLPELRPGDVRGVGLPRNLHGEAGPPRVIE